MEQEIAAADLMRLLGVNKVSLADLAKRGIAVRGKKRGCSLLEESVGRYCQHLREVAAGRGGEAGTTARERLGQAQANLTETKARQLAGELVEASEVETLWRTKLKAFRNRVLAIPHRVPIGSADRGLDARASGGVDRACRWLESKWRSRSFYQL